jgi:hypothetical protein
MASYLTSSRLPAIVVALVGIGWATPGMTHDFWIEPVTFRPPINSSLPVNLRVGEDFNGTSQPYVPDWLVDFSVSTAAGRTAVAGLAGDDPAATLALREPGLRLIGYHSSRSFVDLEAERFNKYLLSEGLERIIELRRQRGQLQANGREYYSRCAKSLVVVGDGPRAGFDRVLGYPLELIPQADPYSLAPGDPLTVALIFKGKPVTGALVIAFTADRPADRLNVRTGSDGRARLPLNRAGRWLVKAVHMIAVPANDPAADWESFWASLTFEVRALRVQP